MITAILGDGSAVAGEGNSTSGPPIADEEVSTVKDRDIGLDQLFEILKNQRRRYVLQYLRANDGKVTLSELSEQIAAWENDKEIRQITSSERKRVYVGLYQCHLPKMDGMDVVSFNKPRATIEPGENMDLFDPYLGPLTDQQDRPWSRYYLGLSAATVFGLALAILVELVVPVPAVALVAATSIAAFAGTSAFHHRSASETDSEGAETDVTSLSSDTSDVTHS